MEKGLRRESLMMERALKRKILPMSLTSMSLLRLPNVFLSFWSSTRSFPLPLLLVHFPFPFSSLSFFFFFFFSFFSFFSFFFSAHISHMPSTSERLSATEFKRFMIAVSVCSSSSSWSNLKEERPCRFSWFDSLGWWWLWWGWSKKGRYGNQNQPLQHWR